MGMDVRAAVSVGRAGAIGLIDIDHPPVNALAHVVREPLLAAIEMLDGDATILAVVISGCGRHFIAGADIREFDAPPKTPQLHDVLARIELCSKPVIAAMHGTTLGGGAELAIACHFRCATRDLSFGFPEAGLGLIPGSGGTVRLPRLVGLRIALEMMVGTKPIGIDAAVSAGIVDRVVDGDLRAGAVDYAKELVAAAAVPRRTRDVPLVAAGDELQRVREHLSPAQKRSAAIARLLEAAEAAVTLPFDGAMARARELFVACRDSTESRALRHLFLSERAAAPATNPREVRCVAVVGAGTMGTGIAISGLLAGYAVALIDTKESAAEVGRARIEATLGDQIAKGRVTAAAVAEAMGRLTTSTTLDALREADLVIEAVFESLEVKQAVFEQLGVLCRAGAVLATNTSTLDVDAIAAASGRASDVVGMHFFSPANVMRLVEVVRGRASAPDAIATTMAVTRRLGKIGVVVGNAYGFVGNRMLYAYGREKELMLLEGVTPERIDRALEGFGMAMGPNAVGDLAGLDIGFHARRAWKEKPSDPRFYRASDLLAELGRLGQKTGRGFYRYEPGARRGVADPEVVGLIAAEAARLGVVPRQFSDEEIVERCILALVNEGARLLDAGIAASAADIDVIWCNGYGFPRQRGGPMFYADTLGAATVLARVQELSRTLGAAYWHPADSLVRLATSGASFASLSVNGNGSTP